MSDLPPRRLLFGVQCRHCRRIIHIHFVILRCVFCAGNNTKLISMDFTEYPYLLYCPGRVEREVRRESDYQEEIILDQTVLNAFVELYENHGPPPLSRRLFNELKTVLSTRSIKDDLCNICFEPFMMGLRLKVLSCEHKFHQMCADGWLRQHETCPLCRAHQDPAYNIIVSAIDKRDDIQNETLLADLLQIPDDDSSNPTDRYFTNRQINDALEKISNASTRLMDFRLQILRDEVRDLNAEALRLRTHIMYASAQNFEASQDSSSSETSEESDTTVSENENDGI